jgi:hypothetical protein
MNNHENLKLEILKVFPKDNTTGRILSDAIVADNWGDQKYINCLSESWKDWTEITNKQIDNCSSLFAFFEDKEISYFVPRYMIWVLDDIQNKIEYEYGCSGDSTISWLLLISKNGVINDLFNNEQQDCISRFLKLSRTEDYEFCFTSPNYLDLNDHEALHEEFKKSNKAFIESGIMPSFNKELLELEKSLDELGTLNDLEK